MSLALEAAGWVGAVLLLAAYALLSMQKLKSTTYTYHGMNVVASFLLVIYSVWKDASAEVLINVVWMCIGLSAVGMMVRARKR